MVLCNKFVVIKRHVRKEPGETFNHKGQLKN